MSKSGIEGIYWEPVPQSWRVTIKVNSKKVYVGTSRSLEEAKKMRVDAENGLYPTKEDRAVALHQKMARIRMRAVWREVTKGEYGWKSFDAFMVDVGDRPKTERKLVAKDERRPIGPENFQWVKPRFDYLTKEGKSEYQKVHRAANARSYKDKDLRKTFGISIVEYEAMLERQGGVCAICKKPESGTRNGKVRWLNVDHNHATGAVRGLLCTNCNVAVGMMNEDRNVLLAAVAYLESWSPETEHDHG